MPLSAAPEVPAFPLWALPEWLGEYAACLAEVTQTPPDLAGCLALAVLSVAASGKVWVQAPAWSEPTCLYVVVVLPPGNRKSEVFRAMTGPLRAAEKTLIEAARPRIAEAVIRRKIAEAAADKTARDAETAAAALDWTSGPPRSSTPPRPASSWTTPPSPPSRACSPTTPPSKSSAPGSPSKAAGSPSCPPKARSSPSPPGATPAPPTSASSNQAHAGEPARTDRMGRTEHIEHATLTLGICTQPGVLTRLGDTPEFREQGLLARLLYAVPESRLGWRNPRPDPMPPAVRDRYTTTLTALILSLCDLPEPATLTFDPAAAQAVTGLLADIEPRFRPGADLAHMTDWGGKLAGATIRIAGLLHLADHVRDGWDRPITPATLEAATEITGYFTGHAKAAYDTIGADPATAHARAILTGSTTTRPAQITARDLMRGHARPVHQSRRPHRTPGHPRIPRLDTPPPPARPGPGRRAARRARLGRAPRRREPAMTTATPRNRPTSARDLPGQRDSADRNRHKQFCRFLSRCPGVPDPPRTPEASHAP